MMQSLQPYHPRVKTMKSPTLFLILIAFISSYILLYSLSIYGPDRTISQTAATKICDKNLAFSRGTNSSAASDDSYKCIFCSRFPDGNDMSLVDLNLDILVDRSKMGSFQGLESEVEMSVLSSQSIFTYCEDLAQFTDVKTFPEINLKRVKTENQNSHFEGRWELSDNNKKTLLPLSCSVDPEKMNLAQCNFGAYQDFQFSSSVRKLGILVKLPLGEKELKTEIQDINLQFIMNNTSFTTFVIVFQMILALSAAAAFTFLLSQLQSYPSQTWLSLYKWTIMLLLAQIVLCNIPSILSLTFQNGFNKALSDIGQNLYVVLIYYFLTSTIEDLLSSSDMRSVFSTKWSTSIKQLLLTAFFLWKSASDLYNRFSSVPNASLLNDNTNPKTTDDMVISCLQICFFIYFLATIVVYVIKTRVQKTLEWSVFGDYLVIFSTLSFLITMGPSLLNSKSEVGLVIQGYNALYIITAAILYAPRSATSYNQLSSDVELSKNSFDVNDAKQIEIVNHADLATPKTESAKAKNKLKWEVIVRTPEHEAPEIVNAEVEDEDDDYIYM